MNDIEKVFWEQSARLDLAEVSHKTGLVVRSFDFAVVASLFAEIEKYEEQERAETFSYLKRALDETRASLGAEAAYKDE